MREKGTKTAHTEEYRVARFRYGRRMAEGARVLANSEAEALEKAKALFYPVEDGETFEIIGSDLLRAVQAFLRHDGGPGSVDYDAMEIFYARENMVAAVRAATGTEV